jgi:hypothetical protein
LVVIKRHSDSDAIVPRVQLIIDYNCIERHTILLFISYMPLQQTFLQAEKHRSNIILTITLGMISAQANNAITVSTLIEKKT